MTALLERWEEFAAAGPGAGPGAELRRAGARRAREAGLPTSRDEDWKFTSVQPIATGGFAPLAEAGPRPDAVSEARLAEHLFGHAEWPRLVFINGRFAPALSRVTGLPAGVRLEPLARVLAEEPGLVAPHLGRVADVAENGFVALNAAYLTDGLVLVLPPDAVVAEPIHLLHVTDGRAEQGMIHLRNVVVVGRGARASLVESFVSLADVPVFTNVVTECVLDDGAHLDHVKVQRLGERAHHVDTTQAVQGRDSTWDSFSFAMGGGLVRTNIYTRLEGPGAHADLDGLYILHGTQHVDHQTRVEHIAPNCTSWEVYKGILDGRSHGVFNGKVFVRPEAQKTDGKQTNQNLLLSPHARVDTKPQLEIFADDVKCTHGATVGRLDPVALFYLQSRGLPELTARRTLTWAFASDILATIHQPEVRRHLEAVVAARMDELGAAPAA